MEEITYLFIDGGYLKKVYENVIHPLFGTSLVLDFGRIKRFPTTPWGTWGNVMVRKAFYYDCLDNIQRPGEPNTDFEDRVAAQEAVFDKINALQGMHVRKGWLSTGRRKKQKEVDVLLAVDMLTHAFYKNMTAAILVAGDRDFRPVVESLVRLGTHVHLVNNPKAVAKGLLHEADESTELTPTMLASWTALEGVRHDTFFPAYTAGILVRNGPQGAEVLEMNGTTQSGREVMLYAGTGIHRVVLVFDSISGRQWTFADKDVLLKFVEAELGPITWTTP